MNHVIRGYDGQFDISIPVVVIGAGAAGLIAALAAHDNGAQVLIVERDANPSGSTALSSGLIPACNTRWQVASKVIDNVEIFSQDIKRKNKGQADERLVDRSCLVSGEVLHWLADNHRQNFDLIEGFLYPGHSVHRMHCHPKRTGKALIDSLVTAVARAGIDIMNSATVTDIFASENSEIVGIRLLRPDGSSEDIGCESLILACNGFGGNPEMVSKYIPEMADAMYFGHQGNLGDAVNWGLELGAAVESMAAYQGHGSVAIPHGALITWAIMMEGGIQLNSCGRRFSNEHEGYSEQAVRVLAQKDSSAWNIYDHRLHELGLEFEEYREANKLGAVKTASTIEELAGILNISRAGLVSTIKECEDFSSGKQKDVLQRDFTSKPPLEAPYYGIQVTGALFHTQGGLTVNGRAQVLQKNGEPFPNLLASGGAATGISGPADWGYLSGNGLLSAVTLGRIAGQTSARLVKH